MKKLLVVALLAAGIAQGTPAHADYCPVFDPRNPKCLIPNMDFMICPVLVALSPGLPGVVDITSEGDVYVSGEFIWDCPPYSG